MRLGRREWVAVPLAAALGVVGLSGVAGGREVIRAVVDTEDSDGDGWTSYEWAPQQVHTVTRGERVRWNDTTGLEHTIKFYKGPWKGRELDLPANGSVSRIVRKRGIYRYRCTILPHSTLTDGQCTGMCGMFHRM
jgi:plastocyanin